MVRAPDLRDQLTLNGDADITPTDPEEVGARTRLRASRGARAAERRAGGITERVRSPRRLSGGRLERPVGGRSSGSLGAGHPLRRRSSPTPTTGQATSSGVMAGSRVSSTGLAGHVVHAASIWAGVGLISFSCSTSKLPTSFSWPMKPRSPGPSATWVSGMAGRSRARTMGSRPGFRTMRPLGGPTSTQTSFGDGTRDGRHASSKNIGHDR